MRLALLSLYPRDPTRIPGGVRAVAYHLVQALRADPSLELHVIHCHSDMSTRETIRDGSVTLHFHGLPRQRLVPNLVTGVQAMRRLLREVRPDVAHAHIPQAAEAALAEGIPTVYTIHGVPHIEARSYRGRLFDRLRYGLTIWYDRRAVARAQALVAISPYVLREYRARRADGWHRIDNPLPDDFFDLRRAPEGGRILFAGTITEVKDIATLLRAFRLVVAAPPPGAPPHLLLAGRVTSPAYEAELRRYVAEQGLAPHVTFAGMLDREALLAEYRRAALLVLSSQQENAPMAVIEALAAGVPVVATAVGGVPDLIRDGATGRLVPPGAPEALADAMRATLADPSEAAGMAATAQAEARGRFRAEAVAARYRELYAAVVGRQG